jgi:tetratricopeptide (TPR) repeat protein
VAFSTVTPRWRDFTRRTPRGVFRAVSLSSFLWVGLVSITILCSIPAFAKQEKALDLYRDAVAADEHGEIEHAIALYRQMLALQPASLEAHSNLGADLASLGRYTEAVTEYQRALKIDPRNSVVRLNLALSHYKLAEYLKAADLLSALQKEQPNNKQTLYLLADCYLRLGRDSDVIKLLTPAYERDRSDQVLLYTLGSAYIHDGKIKEGQEVIDPILKNADTAEANLLLGEVQFAAGDYKTATGTLHKAIDINPNLPGAWSLYGRALLQDNQNDAAKSALQRAIQQDPNDFSANLHLGAMLRLAGDTANAAPYLRRALELRPASPEARLQIGALDVATDQLTEARRVLEQLAKDWPDFVQVHLQLATLYSRLGLKEKSQREQQVVRSLNDKDRQTGPKPDR